MVGGVDEIDGTGWWKMKGTGEGQGKDRGGRRGEGGSGLQGSLKSLITIQHRRAKSEKEKRIGNIATLCTFSHHLHLGTTHYVDSFHHHVPSLSTTKRAFFSPSSLRPLSS